VLLVTGSGDAVDVWDIAENVLVKTFRARSDYVNAVQVHSYGMPGDFSPIIITGTADRTPVSRCSALLTPRSYDDLFNSDWTICEDVGLRKRDNIAVHNCGAGEESACELHGPYIQPKGL
jgi:hypothetical protein